MKTNKIKSILEDYQNGLTHGEIKEKYNLSSKDEFAITECSQELFPSVIARRLKYIEPEMKSKEIEAKMRNDSRD